MSNQDSIAPRQAAIELARALKSAGHKALFAGGSVRDQLCGRTPKDYDIATSARPEEVLKIFPKGNEVGAHFGVIIVRHHGHAIEIATFRTDGSYRDGRHPESVEFSTPEKDAHRRDFTVNGLFEDPDTGEIIDLVHGRKDLEAGIIRSIGDPAKRFQEDALRLLRAVRFASQLGFTIEDNTRRALHDHAALLQKISPERIRDELSKIITSPRRRTGLELLVDTGLIQHMIPEVLPMLGCDQPPEWHPEGDVYTHTCIMLDMLGEEAPLDLCLAVLFHDIGKPPCRSVDADTGRIRFNAHDAVGAEMAEVIMRRLRYPNQLIDNVRAMVERHMKFMHVQQMRTAKLKRFMSAPTFDREMELHRVDCASSNGFTDNYEFLLRKQEEFAAEPLIPEPLVTGRDLIELGCQPGPRFKDILNTIQTEQLEGRVLDRETALTYLQRLASQD